MFQNQKGSRKDRGALLAARFLVAMLVLALVCAAEAQERVGPSAGGPGKAGEPVRVNITRHMSGLKRPRNTTRYNAALSLLSDGPGGHFAPLKAHLASLADEQDLDEGIRFKMINVFNSQYLG